MKGKLLFTIIVLTFICNNSEAQSLYFPPLSGTTWDTISPDSLGWCRPRINSLYNYLEERHTKAFLILQNGKIVLEKYFGTFTADSIWYWASASKSLTAVLTGIAQQEGLLNMNDTVSNFLGNGWTSCTTLQERQITVYNLLTMTSGLNDTIGSPCSNTDTTSSCLQYLTNAGTRWAYHAGAYRKLEDVINIASGISYNLFTYNRIGSHIGMTGAWVAQEFFSKPRSMARFGLLVLNKGIWANDTILHDTIFVNAMTKTSQIYNQSYGYLWWLNGKDSYMAPGLQYVFPHQLFDDAPSDLYAALGKNDQKLYIVPSRNMVVVRMGDAAYSSVLAFSQFDNELWQYIDHLTCSTSVNDIDKNEKRISIFPNPANTELTIDINQSENFQVKIINLIGKVMIKQQNKNKIDISTLKNGMYIIKVVQNEDIYTYKILKQ